MKKVDITGIHRIMTRYYGSRNLTMYTNVEERHFINPYSLKLEFDFNPDCDTDFLTMLRRLKRYFINVNLFLSINKDENKIILYALVYDKPAYKDFDFKFSEN
jgi:hypothetical protein